MNGGPRRVNQKPRFSDQRGHIEDGDKPREQDDEETEADETEEHRGSDPGPRIEVLVEERATTVVVVERKPGVKDGDHAEDQRDEPS